VGQDSQAGIFRYTFGQVYLWSGFGVIPVMVGLFAIPEIINLAVQGTGIASDVSYGKLSAGVKDGIRDTFRHFGLTIRCSFIGSVIGILPGVGGGVSQWISYAHATQSARTPEEREGFGKGDIRGVLGPGASNNSKEGANLIPTVAFGIPASTGMAILLGAFLIMGLIPGPDMLTKHLTLTYSMVWTIVISNIIVVPVCLLFIDHLAKLTTVRGSVIIPIIVLLCFIGAYTSNNNVGDLIVFLVFGAIGYCLMRQNWPRPPFILGFVLGRLSEGYLFTASLRYGATWLYRPKVILILIIIIAFVLYPSIQRKRLEKKGKISEIQS
jgi:TctA family transporter